MHKYIFAIIFVGIITIIDFYSKLYMRNMIQFEEIYNVFPGFNLTLVYNYGAAFGLMGKFYWQKYLFVGLTFVFMMAIVYWIKRTFAENKDDESFALLCILSGAIGNLIDRLLYGYVVDWIDLYYKDYHWYAFNIADVAICLGASIIVLGILRGKI